MGQVERTFSLKETFDKEVLNVAVPKNKISKAKGRSRRASAWTLEAPTLVRCPQCGDYKVAHQVCKTCGYYNGREVIKKEA